MNIYTKLLLAFLPASLIAISVSGFLLFTSATQTVTQQVFDHLTLVASIQKNQIENIIEQNHERLSLITSRTQLRLSLVKFLHNHKIAHQIKMNQILTDAQASIGSFKRISVLSPDGMVQASTDISMIGKSHPEQAKLFISPHEKSFATFSRNTQGQLRMTLSGPLYLQNKLIGIVVIASDVSNILAMVSDYSGMGATGESYLVTRDEHGNAMFLTPLRFDPDAALTRKIPKTETTSPAIQALSDEKRGVTTAINYHGKVALNATKHIQKTAWGLVSSIGQSEAFEPIEDLKIFLISVLLSTSLFIVIISIFLARMITRPIIALTQATSEATEGNNLPNKVAVYSNDELGTLTHTFNRMADRLFEMNHSLKKKVEELNIEISERQQVEEQFRQAQKMEALGTLVGGLAHDFNNILAGIMGNIYLIRKYVNDDKALKHLDHTQILSQRGADLIKQLLAFARKGSVNTSVFLACEFMRETLKLAQVGIPKNIHLECHTKNEELMLCCDISQLQQAVLNILNNARDAVEGVSAPQIDISLSTFEADENFHQKHPNLETSSLARISLHDNGVGIEHEHINKIFEPFFTTKSIDKGTGLGLAMVYGCITRFGGAIEVESEKGVGTTFHLYIPLSSETSETTNRTHNIMEAPDLGGKVILIADDEAILREATSKTFTDFGCSVLQAEDGLKAIATFSAAVDTIDVVILDMAMPQCNGSEAAKQIRALRDDIPIIFITGYTDDMQDDVTKMPNTFLFSKPFQIEALIRTVAQLTSH